MSIGEMASLAMTLWLRMAQSKTVSASSHSLVVVVVVVGPLLESLLCASHLRESSLGDLAVPGLAFAFVEDAVQGLHRPASQGFTRTVDAVQPGLNVADKSLGFLVDFVGHG